MVKNDVIRLRPKQEAFAQAVVVNGGDKYLAYKDAGYSTKMSVAMVRTQADKLFNHKKVKARIKQLRKSADKAQEKKFNISVTRRLKWLEEIVDAGLSEYKDANKQKRRENLSAAKGAIAVINEMLGVTEGDGDDEESSTPIGITFSVKEAVAEVEITKHEP